MTTASEARPVEGTREDDARRLAQLVRARHPAIFISTGDEEEAWAVVRRGARELGAHVWTWDAVDGVRDASGADMERGGSAPIPDTANPGGGMVWLARQDLPSVMVLFDVSGHLHEPITLRALRRLIAHADRVGSTAVLIDHAGNLPEAVAGLCTPFEMALPGEAAIERCLRDALKRAHRRSPIEIDLRERDYRMILKNLRGLTRRQVERVVTDVVADDRRLDAEDLNRVLAAKRRLVSGQGALEYVESPASLDAVGGLRNLKRWLAEREASFGEKARAYGLTPPRGVLLLGVQGAGKSLCAKAIATAWSRPLLRLDPGSLYDRYVGESERRLREALRQAEAMAPIVLWVDEIEKGFASAAAHSTDGGLSQRMFGTLLTWMNDHAAPVFLVATANNIDALPPELLRKGRFDEIFFVDLPGEEAREAILRIHLGKRGRDPGKFDLPRLVAASAGYSGAEIEQAIIAALHRAHARSEEVGTADVLAAIEGSPPLSVTMGERVARLRAWARDRCVPAE